MNIFKKILAICTITALMLTFACACGKGGNNNTSNNTTATEINFAEDEYVIVRNPNNEVASSATRDIIKAVKASTDKSLKAIDDSEPKSDKGEIIVGNTSRPQSAKALELLREQLPGRAKEYIVCYIDGAIVINGMTEAAISAGVERFIADYCSTCKVLSNLNLTFKDEGTYTDISIDGINISQFRIVLPEFNISYLAKSEVDILVEEIFVLTGFKLSVVRDNTESAANEIIIGACARDGVTPIKSNDEFSINYQNGKVYINGGRNYSLAHAIIEFTNQIKVGGVINTAAVNGSYNGTDSADREYKLKWKEEFDSFDIETSDIWRAQQGVQSYYGSWYGMGTARSTSYENLRANDGKLYICATYDDDNFYGVYLDTAKSLNFTKGYMEMSARFADGDGIWFDWWTWSDKKEHLEFDISECWGPGTAYANVIHEFTYPDGVNRQDKSSHEAHIASTGEHLRYSDWLTYRIKEDSLSLNKDFHTYACEWTDEEVIFYLDGVVTSSYKFAGTETAYLYEQPHYFVLSMLVGSNYNDYTVDTDIIKERRASVLNPKLDADYWTNGKNEFVIDYIQLFQKDGQFIEIK